MRIVGLSDKGREFLNKMHYEFDCAVCKAYGWCKEQARTQLVRLANYVLRKLGQRGLPYIVQ